ncbi:MAG: hypothetical protein GY830_03035 [Bacteroidetes bacterium]|nr:hypothetical protein [Bacteroidota bacterium]
MKNFLMSYSFFQNKRKILISQIKTFISIIIITTCVPGDPPKGGPEDKKPPMLLEKKSNPKNGQTNFNRKRLVFRFNKEIKLNNPHEEIKIIPTLKKGKSQYGYTYVLNRNIELVLYLDKELDKNTLYVINFGKAISSLHGNVVNENISVTFSTGPNIDSISAKGKVTNIETGEAIPNIYVSLYKSERNKTVLNDAPDYFTKTDAQGNFEIKYIKPNKYSIFASNKINFQADKNQNIGIDVIGFIKKPINIKKNLKNIKIHAVKKDLDDLKIVKQEIKNGRFKIIFNKQIKNYSIKLKNRPKYFNNIPQIGSSLEKNKKEIIIYNWFYDRKNNVQEMLEEDKKIEIAINAIDDLGNKFEQELFLHFGEDDFNKEDFEIYVRPGNSEFINKNCEIKVNTNKLIKNIDINKIYFLDKNGNKYNVNPENINFKKFTNEIIIRKTLKNDINDFVNLTFTKGAIISIEKDISKELNYIYKIKNKTNTGSLKGKLYLGLENFTIQLLDDKFNIIDEIKNKTEYSFDNITEGNYTIRVLGLSKGRSDWFSGNIKNLEQPDPIFLYHTQNGYVKILPGIKRTLKSFVFKIKN